MNNSWLIKSLLISAAIGLVTCLGLYFFFNIHRELEIQTAYAWRLGLLTFFLSFVVAAIYFRMRTGR